MQEYPRQVTQQPQLDTKLFAQFRTFSGGAGEVREIKNVQEAIEYGAKNNAFSFQTFEVASVTQNGKVLKGEPENFSGTHYLQVDKVLTAAEIAGINEAKATEYQIKVEQDQKVYDSAKAAFNASTDPWSKKSEITFEPKQTLDRDESWLDVYRSMGFMFRSEPLSKPYIEEAGKSGEYISINANDKVYDRKSQQIYPQTSAPAPKNKKHGFLHF